MPRKLMLLLLDNVDTVLQFDKIKKIKILKVSALNICLNAD